MAYTIVLTSDERQLLKRLQRVERDGKLLRRYQCILMVHDNKLSKKEIAQILGVHIDTITDWVKLFTKDRLDGLGQLHYEGRRPSCLDSVKDILLNYVQENTVSKLSEIQEFLRITHSIEIEHSWLSRYCKKNFIAVTKRQD